MKQKFVLAVALSLAVFVIGFELSKSETSISIENPNYTLTSTPEPTSVSLLTFGDLMLDRSVRVRINQNGLTSILDPMRSFIAGHDIVMANLEGTFTNYPSQATTKNLVFTFDPKSVPILKDFGFSIFSMANNHSGNFGADGLAQTRNYLTQNDIDFFGDPYNTGQISKIKDIRGVKTAFVGFDEFGSNQQGVIEEIKKLRPQADFVVVMPHWGIEYNEGITADQQKSAHEFVDAGADVVIGSHPHVIEPIEIYKNKAIFYSLGNFVFDQFFSENTKQGLAVVVNFNKKEMDFSLFPFMNQNWQIDLLPKDQSDIILNKIASGSVVDQETKTKIRSGGFKINNL